MLTLTIVSSGQTVQRMLKRHTSSTVFGVDNKLIPEPSRILEFLELHFSLEQALISPSKSFLETLTSVLSHLSTSTIMSAHKITSINCRISHFAPFIHHGRLQLRFLQFWIEQRRSQHAQPWDSPIQLNQEYISHLHWFCNPEVLQGVLLHTPGPNLDFFRDASLMGWGASWQEQQIMGQWSPLEQQQHINWQELEAVCLAICHWGPHWFQQTDRVYCDNSTAVAYISKLRGGTHSLSLFHKTLELFQLPDMLAIILVPTHLQGARNVTADGCTVTTRQSQSHGMASTTRDLSLFSAFGAALMNMFATAENKVTPIYVLPYPDDIAWAIEAISISWDDLRLTYAFPPAPIVPQTLERIRTSRGTTLHRSIHHGHCTHSCYN